MLLRVARDEKLSRVTADILPDNLEMQRMSQRLGFTLLRDLQDPVVRAEINL
jgi:acetyltransferase